MRLACFVGAGYSAVAGLPLAAELFDERIYADVGAGSSTHIDAVHADYYRWMRDNPGKSPEEYLTSLYESLFENRPPFDWAVELIAAALAVPAGKRWRRRRFVDVRYHVRATDPSEITPHVEFWKILRRMGHDLSIVTTNYDLLIEQAMRMRPMKSWSTPGAYYGGFSRPQVLLGSQFRSRTVMFECTGSVPIYKLHGSLNWGPAFPGVEFYIDFRAAYRRRRRALIVPPASGKKPFDVLRPVWTQAAADLAAANVWVVCGYSLPPYDIEVLRFLHDLPQKPSKVIIVDPKAKMIRDRWAAATGASDVVCLPGLPGGLTRLERTLSRVTQ